MNCVRNRSDNACVYIGNEQTLHASVHGRSKLIHHRRAHLNRLIYLSLGRQHVVRIQPVVGRCVYSYNTIIIIALRWAITIVPCGSVNAQDESVACVRWTRVGLLSSPVWAAWTMTSMTTQHVNRWSACERRHRTSAGYDRLPAVDEAAAHSPVVVISARRVSGGDDLIKKRRNLFRVAITDLFGGGRDT